MEDVDSDGTRDTADKEDERGRSRSSNGYIEHRRIPESTGNILRETRMAPVCMRLLLMSSAKRKKDATL